jgi:hypothetical protein
LPGVLGIDAAVNERILSGGSLTRDVNEGHECRLYQLEELHSLLDAAGLEDIEIQAPGWLTAVHDTELPPEGSAQWRFLLNAELRASRESPAAGTHLLASARAPKTT